MSFLSANRFAAGDSDGELPKQVRTSRVLLWIQGVLGILAAAFVGVTTWQIQHLSDAEIAKQTKGQLSHEQIPYVPIYGFAAAIALVAVALIWCARTLPARKRTTRLVTYIAEGMLIPVSVFNMTVYTSMQMACLFILPAIATIVLLSTRPVKDWYAAQ